MEELSTIEIVTADLEIEQETDKVQLDSRQSLECELDEFVSPNPQEKSNVEIITSEDFKELRRPDVKGLYNRTLNKIKKNFSDLKENIIVRKVRLRAYTLLYSWPTFFCMACISGATPLGGLSFALLLAWPIDFWVHFFRNIRPGKMFKICKPSEAPTSPGGQILAFLKLCPQLIFWTMFDYFQRKTTRGFFSVTEEAISKLLPKNVYDYMVKRLRGDLFENLLADYESHALFYAGIALTATGRKLRTRDYLAFMLLACGNHRVEVMGTLYGFLKRHFGNSLANAHEDSEEKVKTQGLAEKGLAMFAGLSTLSILSLTCVVLLKRFDPRIDLEKMLADYVAKGGLKVADVKNAVGLKEWLCTKFDEVRHKLSGSKDHISIYLLHEKYPQLDAYIKYCELVASIDSPSYLKSDKLAKVLRTYEATVGIPYNILLSKIVEPEFRVYVDRLRSDNIRVMQRIKGLYLPNTSPRISTLPIILHGFSSIGKSENLIPGMSAIVLDTHSLPINNIHSDIWVPNPLSKHDDGYVAHRIIVRDEYTRRRTGMVVTAEDDWSSPIMAETTNNTLLTNQASLENKGQIPFVHLASFYTANVDSPSTEHLVTGAEPIRRRGMWIFPDLLDEFSLPRPDCRGAAKIRARVVSCMGTVYTIPQFNYGILNKEAVVAALKDVTDPLELARTRLSFYRYHVLNANADAQSDRWVTLNAEQLEAYIRKNVKERAEQYERVCSLQAKFSTKDIKFLEDFLAKLLSEIEKTKENQKEIETQGKSLLSGKVLPILGAIVGSGLFLYVVKNVFDYLWDAAVPEKSGCTYLNCTFGTQQTFEETYVVFCNNGLCCSCSDHKALESSMSEAERKRIFLSSDFAESKCESGEPEGPRKMARRTPPKQPLPKFIPRAQSGELEEEGNTQFVIHKANAVASHSTIKNCDDIVQAYARNVLFISRKENILFAVSGFGIIRNFFVMPKHYFIYALESSGILCVRQGINPNNLIVLKRDHVRFVPFEVVGVAIDCVLVEVLGNSLGFHFRDSFSKFICEEDVKFLTGAETGLAGFALLRCKEQIIFQISTIYKSTYFKRVNEGNCYHDLDGRYYPLARSVHYDIPTRSTMCGSLVLALHDSVQAPLVGIHHAGDGASGYGIVLTSETLRAYVQSMSGQNFGPVLCQAGDEVNPHLYLVGEGFGPPACSRSELRRSIFPLAALFQLGELEGMPARLRAHTDKDTGVVTEPMYKRLFKLTGGPEKVDPYVVSQAVSSLKYDMYSKGSVNSLTHWDFPTAYKGDDYIESIKTRSSIGVPECMSKDSEMRQKKYYIPVQDSAGKLSNPKGAVYVERKSCLTMLELLKRKIYFPAVVLPKDEVLLKKKVLNNDTRNFNMLGVVMGVVARVLFGPVCSLMRKDYIGNGSAIGLNPYSKDYERIWEKLHIVPDPSIVSLDGSGFEYTFFNEQIAHAIADIFEAAFDGCVQSFVWRNPENESEVFKFNYKELAIIRRNFVLSCIGGALLLPKSPHYKSFNSAGILEESILKTLQQDIGYLVDSDVRSDRMLYNICYAQMHISGGALTIFINTICAKLWPRLCYFSLMRKRGMHCKDSSFSKIFADVAVGDDIIISCVPNNGIVCFDDILAEASSYGIKYSMANKGESDQLTFCSRTFDFDNIGITPKLKQSSLFKMLMWVRTKNVVEASLLNAENALYEMVYYGKEYYNFWRDVLLKLCKNMGVSFIPRTFDEQMRVRIDRYSGKEICRFEMW